MSLHTDPAEMRTLTPVEQSAEALFHKPARPKPGFPHRINRYDGKFVIEEGTSKGWFRLDGAYETPGFAWQVLNDDVRPAPIRGPKQGRWERR